METVVTYIGEFLHSPSTTIETPAVIRFIAPHSPAKSIIRFSRKAIYLRDEGRCAYCSRHVSEDSYTWDHVVPKTSGGKTSWTNVVIACKTCNTKKGGRSPGEAGMLLRIKPVKPKTLPKTQRRFTWRESYPVEWKDWLR